MLSAVIGNQLYVVAPVALSDVGVLAHTVVDPVAATVGIGFTATVTVFDPEQLPDVPVTVYVVLTVGLAVGLEILATLNPVVGNQLYELAPVAVITVLFPLQIVVVPVIIIVGNGVTLTVIVFVPVQAPTVPLTVYVVVTVGDATGLAIFDALNPVEGDQL